MASLSFIITSVPVISICVECGDAFHTERVTDEFGEVLRSEVCYTCHEHVQSMVAEWESERYLGL